MKLKELLFFPFLLFAINCCAANNNNSEEPELVEYIKSRANDLELAADLDKIIEPAKNARLVLLGEASHGTHEYYAWRDSISRRLISEHGFNFIAVEGDFASLYELNRYVKNMPGAAQSAHNVLTKLDRWPPWMWGNKEVLNLAEWLREFNNDLPDEKKVGFYGKDVYDEWRSKDAVLSVLENVSSDIFNQVKEQYRCLAPYKPDSWMYARAVASGNPDCTDELKNAVQIIENHREEMPLSDYEYFYLLQNALVVKHAEKFYRKAATSRDASSWNSRARYMHFAVERLLKLYGEDSKGIVWAHNTHIGDARFTEMQNWGQENIGHLSRVKHGPENVFLIGFGTWKGTVKAGSQWGSRMQKMNIPEAAKNSHEDILSKVKLDRYFLVFNDDDRRHSEFTKERGNRAVGVVYNPANDHRQNYVSTILPLRYDAFIFFRETKALEPIKR